MNAHPSCLLSVTLTLLGTALLQAQVSTDGPRYTPPKGHEIVTAHTNDFRDLLDRYPRDRETFQREFPSRLEEKRIAGLGKFFEAWHRVLLEMDFDKMTRSGQVDYILFRHRLERDQEQFAREAAHLRTIAALLPPVEEITALEYQRRSQDKYDPQKLAPKLEKLARSIDEKRQEVEEIVTGSRKRQQEEGQDEMAEKNFKAAEDASRELQRVVENWFNYYRGYDPLLTWWIAAPSKKLSTSLGTYADAFKPDPKHKPKPVRKP